MNAFEQMRNGVSDARQVMRSADHYATSFAELLEGRLNKVSSWRLKKLKKELQNFNAKTGEWK